MKNKKKVNAKAAQKEVERELSEDSLGQVAGGFIVLTGEPERDRQQIEAFKNLPHMRKNSCLEQVQNVKFGGDN